MGTAFGQAQHATLSLSPAFDLSAERCARSVRDLSTMTRAELEAFLVATARASASVIPERARRPKPPKVRRTWRPSWSASR